MKSVSGLIFLPHTNALKQYQRFKKDEYFKKTLFLDSLLSFCACHESTDLFKSWNKMLCIQMCENATKASRKTWVAFQIWFLSLLIRYKSVQIKAQLTKKWKCFSYEKQLLTNRIFEINICDNTTITNAYCTILLMKSQVAVVLFQNGAYWTWESIIVSFKDDLFRDFIMRNAHGQ